MGAEGDDDLVKRFVDLARSAHRRAPLYAYLSARIAEDGAVLNLLRAAPVQQQLPVLLLAAVHDLVLDGEAPDLAKFYPNVAPMPAQGDSWPVFRRVCLEHADRLTYTIATRHTQTNEVGRCSLFLPAFQLIAADTEQPIRQIDVGTSAGLTLRWASYSYRFEHGEIVTTLGDRQGVLLACGVHGTSPVPYELVRAVGGIGIDAHPIDVRDDAAVRWLEACVWPDQADRFARLASAIAAARVDPPDVRRGDAVADIAALVDEVCSSGCHPVLTTSWVMNYLTHAERVRFVDQLDRCADRHDLSWVIAESPALTDGIPLPTHDPNEDVTVLAVVTWRKGHRTMRRLATAHPHGYWLRWATT